MSDDHSAHRSALYLSTALSTALAFGIVAAWPVAGARARGVTPGDQSVTTAAKGVGSVVLKDRRRARHRFAGTVVRIERPKNARSDCLHAVVLRDGAGALDDRLELCIASGATVPFRAGSFIQGQVDCARGGWHYVCNATISDRQNQLLLAVAGDGDAAAAPGWTVALGARRASTPRQGIKPRSVRHEHGLQLTFANLRALTDPARWRQLTAGGVTWLLTGSAVRWEGPRPPEGVDYTTFAVTRVAGR